MTELQNYACALCCLRQHMVDILCKLEVPASTNVFYTPAQKEDRATVARVIYSAKSNQQSILSLLSKLMGAVAKATSATDKTVTDAGNALFAYMNANTAHLLFLNIYGQQIMNNQGYAYTYGVYLKDKNGVKMPAYSKNIPVLTSTQANTRNTQHSECDSTLPPYPPVPVFPPLVAGSTKSLSMLTTNQIPQEFFDWVATTLLGCTVTRDQVNEHLCASDAIKSFLTGCGVCKITITNAVTGTKLILTSSTGTPPTKTLPVPTWALNGTWIVYVGENYTASGSTLGIEVDRPVSNPMSTVTIANTMDNSCVSKTMTSACLKATLKPTLSFTVPMIIPPANLIVKTNWLTDTNACSAVNEIRLYRPQTIPPDLPISVKLDGRMLDDLTDTDYYFKNVTIGQHTAVYTANVLGADNAICDTAIYTQIITVVNGVIPEFTARTPSPQIVMGDITDSTNTKKIGANVRPEDFTPVIEDPCNRTPSPFTYKLRENASGSPVPAISYTTAGSRTIELLLMNGQEVVSAVTVSPVIFERPQ